MYPPPHPLLPCPQENVRELKDRLAKFATEAEYKMYEREQVVRRELEGEVGRLRQEVDVLRADLAYTRATAADDANTSERTRVRGRNGGRGRGRGREREEGREGGRGSERAAARGVSTCLEGMLIRYPCPQPLWLPTHQTFNYHSPPLPVPACLSTLRRRT